MVTPGQAQLLLVAGPRMCMSKPQCPICNGPLKLPEGAHEPHVFLAVLTKHFEESCTAIATPKATDPDWSRHGPSK